MRLAGLDTQLADLVDLVRILHSLLRPAAPVMWTVQVSVLLSESCADWPCFMVAAGHAVDRVALTCSK